jgi:hypothetical protein
MVMTSCTCHFKSSVICECSACLNVTRSCHSACDVIQPRVNSLLLYLSRFGQHVCSANLDSGAWKHAHIVELPQGLRLEALRLQYVSVQLCPGSNRRGVLEAFLVDLQQLTQLTYLSFKDTLFHDDVTPAAAYAALTASSKLQLLHLHWCKMPTAAWQHMLPLGKQLPHLEDLEFFDCPPMSATDIASLVSCCPSLQRLRLSRLQGDPVQVLTPLCSLTGLQDLSLYGPKGNGDAALGCLGNSQG